MIYVVVLRGTPALVSAAVETCRQWGGGFCPVGSPGVALGTTTNVVLVQSQYTEDVLRNFLGRTAGLEILVAQLTGSWAAKGLNEIAHWLQEARLFF